MSDQFVAEVRVFACNFAPKGWALCNGQLMAIAQNTALFSLLGTTYGGDGKSTFGLPKIQGNAVMAPGNAPGLSSYDLGQEGGSSTVTLQSQEMAQHTHTLRAHAADPADLNGPGGLRSIARSNGGNAYGPQDGGTVAMSPTAVSVYGSGNPHNNAQPSLVLNYCIALQGIFPSRP